MLDDRQCRQFLEDGFAVCPELISATAAAALLRELEGLQRQGRCWDVSLQPAAAQPPTNLHFSDLAGASPLFRALVTAPPLVSAARQLLGAPLVFLQDQAFLKPPFHGAGTCWHQDNAYFRFPDPTRGVGIWIALHAATIANGTMRVIPGSHRTASAHAPCPGTAYLQEARSVDESRAVPIELAPGGALLFNNAVLHCTRDNTSPAPRAAVAVHYVHASQCAERPSALERVIARSPGDGAWHELDEPAWAAAVASASASAAMAVAGG